MTAISAAIALVTSCHFVPTELAVASTTERPNGSADWIAGGQDAEHGNTHPVRTGQRCRKRRRQCLHGRGIELADDRLWRALRRIERGPRRHVEALQPLLIERRHVRQAGRARQRGDAMRHNAAYLFGFAVRDLSDSGARIRVKDAVVALREIAEKTISPNDMRRYSFTPSKSRWRSTSRP